MPELNPIVDPSQGNPDVLNLLMQLLSPGGAEAAQQTTDPWRQQYLLMQAQQRAEGQARSQALAEKRQQENQQIQQERLKLSQQKAQPKPDVTEVLRNILGTPGAAPGATSDQYDIRGNPAQTTEQSNERIRYILEALQGGQAPQAQAEGPGAVRAMDKQFFTPKYGAESTYGESPFWLKGMEGQVGYNPETKAFTNVGIAPTQTMQVQVPGATTTTAFSPEEVAKYSKVAENLKSVPEAQRGAILEGLFPAIHKQRMAAHAEQTTVDLKGKTEEQRRTFILQNAASFYNNKTGELLTSHPDLGEKNATDIYKNYTYLKPAKEQDLKTFNTVTGYIDRIKQLTDQLPLGITGAGGRLTSGVTLTKLRLAGDQRVAQIDAAKAQITQLARGFGGDSRVSDQEMKRLDAAFAGDWDTRLSADARIDELFNFRKIQADALKLPWLKTQSQGQAATPEATPGQSQITSGGVKYRWK